MPWHGKWPEEHDEDKEQWRDRLLCHCGWSHDYDEGRVRDWWRCPRCGSESKTWRRTALRWVPSGYWFADSLSTREAVDMEFGKYEERQQ